MPAPADLHPPRRRRAATRLLAMTAFTFGALAVGACGTDGGGSSSGTDRPLVVVTTTHLADFARTVGGDDVEVYGILQPNVDAHDVEPSPKDLDALARADVIVANGLGLEPWLADAVDASGTEVEVVDASEGAAILEDEGVANPHLWFDPANAEVMVGHVADAIAAAAPAAATEVRGRAAGYAAELDALDSWIEGEIDTLEDPKIVTDHDAFPYYFERYGITSVGSIIPSFDSSAEISASDLNDLAAAIEAEDVAAIFTEQALPPKAAEALGRKVDVEVVSGEDGLYGDSLGPEGSSGETYLKMMRHNTSTIVDHL